VFLIPSAQRTPFGWGAPARANEPPQWVGSSTSATECRVQSPSTDSHVTHAKTQGPAHTIIDMRSLSEWVGYVGAAISAASMLPQARRVHRFGVTGVSAATYQIALASGLMWIGYGILFNMPPQLPGNAIGCICSVFLLWKCWQAGQSLLSVSAISAAAIAACAIALVAGNPAFLGWFGGVISCSMRVPQIRAAAFSPRVDGVSALSWTAGIACNLCWFVYAIGHSDPPLIIATSVNMFASYCIVQIVALRRRNRRSEGFHLNRVDARELIRTM
jgi:uncharacterized protein with PQ loop repeat